MVKQKAVLEGKPENAHRLQRKNNIAMQALELFEQNGFHQTSIRDIARGLGVSNSMLYEYFKSKEDIILYVSQGYLFEIFEGQLDRIKDLLKDKKLNYADKLKLIFRGVGQYPFKYKNMLSEITTMIMRNNLPEMRKLYDRMINNVILF